MPKYNDFELDLQTDNLNEVNAKDPWSVQICPPTHTNSCPPRLSDIVC